MAELARKDRHSLGISTKKPKARQECRAGIAAAGRAGGVLAWGLEFTSPCRDKKVANGAHSKPDLQSHTARE